MKNFNKGVFIISIIAFCLLLFPSFIAAGAEDEGTLGTNIIWLPLSKLFYILRFPIHTLLFDFISQGGMLTYFIGLLINGFFWGVIAERLVSLLLTKSNKQK